MEGPFYSVLAQLLTGQGRFQEAERHLLRAFQLRESPVAESLFLLGTLHQRQQRIPEAARCFCR